MPLPVQVISAVPGNVAAAADSVLLNVTVPRALHSRVPGDLPVQHDAAQPTVSDVNSWPATHPNLVDVKLARNKSVCVTSNAGTHVIVDLLGWYQA